MKSTSNIPPIIYTQAYSKLSNEQQKHLHDIFYDLRKHISELFERGPNGINSYVLTDYVDSKMYFSCDTEEGLRDLESFVQEAMMQTSKEDLFNYTQ